ncbi:hypothetical protein Leryth_020565 [Lithospermum erythrorhizon]|uniref:Cyclin-dependent kinase inhibitor domain-containing protein n=1 Tax=Lithospermum erythrorhizon TaxID=34254 RepID=A0AAV3Q9U4_LITER|nr:hypothetical protein Leryth_020565 [Lithospermum erythrorhizon]
MMRKTKKTMIEAKHPLKKGPKKENGEFMQLRSRRLYKSPPMKLLKKRKLKVEEIVVVEKEVIKLVENVDQELEQKDNRAMRERTPEHLIMKSEYIIATGSSTKAPRDDVAAHGPLGLQGICVPSAENIETFFDASERQQERHFTEKYNFNFKNETPLPGRYEWMKVE